MESRLKEDKTNWLENSASVPQLNSIRADKQHHHSQSQMG